jgi:hypothetical protein
MVYVLALLEFQWVQNSTQRDKGSKGQRIREEGSVLIPQIAFESLSL